MPLFGGNRDAGFLRGINMELLHQVVSNEVVVYKISHEETTINLYGETKNRRYKQGVRVFSYIELEDKISQADNDVLDINNASIFSFIKSDLKNQNLFLEIGDIIMYNDLYFEIDNVIDGRYWAGRNPNTNIGMTIDKWALHGYDYTIVVEAHMTNKEVLNIEENVRGSEANEYIPPSIPKFL